MLLLEKIIITYFLINVIFLMGFTNKYRDDIRKNFEIKNINKNSTKVLIKISAYFVVLIAGSILFITRLLIILIKLFKNKN